MRRAACARAVAVVVVPLLLLASRAAVSRAAGGAPASPPPASPRADDACAADNAACSAEDASGAAAAARLRGFLGSAQTGENIAATIYRVSAHSVGVQLTDYELAFHERVITNVSAKGGDTETEGRTTCADDIEAEDRALEDAKRKNEAGRGGCCVVS